MAVVGLVAGVLLAAPGCRDTGLGVTVLNRSASNLILRSTFEGSSTAWDIGPKSTGRIETIGVLVLMTPQCELVQGMSVYAHLELVVEIAADGTVSTRQDSAPPPGLPELPGTLACSEAPIP